MTTNPAMAIDWQAIGLVLALVLLFAIGMAVLTRYLTRNGPEGQTFGLVALGVGGVLGIAGLVVGYAVVGVLVVCFLVAAVPMALEYYQRVIAAERLARKIEQGMISKGFVVKASDFNNLITDGERILRPGQDNGHPGAGG